MRREALVVSDLAGARIPVLIGGVAALAGSLFALLAWRAVS